MGRLEVLCVAMYQNDFSLAEKMKLHCDAVIANQTNDTSVSCKVFPWGKVRLVSTQTRGVGKNRNIGFTFSEGEILLLADDDMVYSDTYIEDVLSEFDAHPDADVIVFNIDSSDEKRKQYQNKKTKRLRWYDRFPYGGPRIAVRRSSWEKSNVWFTPLFGGGAKYTNGEDSLFLSDLKKKHLKIYASKKKIGTVCMDDSCWYKGANEEFFFNKGAFYQAAHPRTKLLRAIRICIEVRSDLPFRKRFSCVLKGFKAFRLGERFAVGENK